MNEFMPRFLKRDEALRRKPRAPYAWDGVADVRPFGAMEKTLVEGVYGSAPRKAGRSGRALWDRALCLSTPRPHGRGCLVAGEADESEERR
jgi:hypothetical protein